MSKCNHGQAIPSIPNAGDGGEVPCPLCGVKIDWGRHGVWLALADDMYFWNWRRNPRTSLGYALVNSTKHGGRKQ